MLMGEHAVLRGKPALVAAVNERLSVDVFPRDDELVRIESDLGFYCKPYYDLRIEAPFQFILSAAMQCWDRRGVDITVRSSFASTVGLGSSAAVTVACVTALTALNGEVFDLAAVFARSVKAMRGAQSGLGSGADVAAATYGGILRYERDGTCRPLKAELPEISLIYCGYKKPTPEVIRIVQAFESAHPSEARAIFAEMEKRTLEAESALEKGNLEQMGREMDRYHACQQALGVSNEDLDLIAAGLSASPGMLGAKITGAGLGDCVFGLGAADATVSGYEKLNVQLSTTGVHIEEG
ncbi:MAG: mevalonate kinase [Kiritimatiellia bacterium]|jgi:mevalonate kinase